jgi:glycosyltransferase involved in cell wall biosynthesis
MTIVAAPSSVLVVLHVEKHSGPQHSLRPRIEALAEHGARITTLVPAAGPAADLASELGDVRIGIPTALLVPRRPTTAAKLPLAVGRQARVVSDAVRATGADLVIVASALMPGALLGARRSGAGVVLYSGELLAGNRGRGLAMGGIARLASRCADSILACSFLVAHAYRVRGGAAAVLSPPIEAPGDVEALASRGAELRRRLGIDAGERVVCSLGAITEGRGQDTLIEALARSAQRGVRWRLVIGGEAYDRAADIKFSQGIRGLIERLGLGDRVTLAGRIDDPQALYASADLFVNPARFAEPFGRAACEALSAGCPVVATRVGGVVEALRDGETAILVEPDSPADLATAIEDLLEDRDLAMRLARAGAAAVAQRFAPEMGEAVFGEAVRAALAARAARTPGSDLSEPLQPVSIR